jgi:hypothetical protein
MVNKDQKISKITKRGALKKKAKPNATLLTSTAPKDNLTDEQKKIRDLLLHAQIEFSKVKLNIVKDKQNEFAALEDQIKEFMGPFMLIGYDLNNNPIEMVSANSASEHDALLERFRRVMFKINQNIANSGGNDPYGYNNSD